jgi:hypothetical protein
MIFFVSTKIIFSQRWRRLVLASPNLLGFAGHQLFGMLQELGQFDNKVSFEANKGQAGTSSAGFFGRVVRRNEARGHYDHEGQMDRPKYTSVRVSFRHRRNPRKKRNER